MKLENSLINLLVFLLFCSILAGLSACKPNNDVEWPDNLLQNPDAEQGLDYWTFYDEGVLIDGQQGDSPCFSVRHGASLFQTVPINQQNGEYALLIGCVAASYVHPNGSITDLPIINGDMLSNNTHVDKGVSCQDFSEIDYVQDEWTTVWGIFSIPETTEEIRFFMGQALRAGDPYTGAPAYFDDLGLYQFDSEELALRFVDRYLNRCGTTSMVEIVPGNTLTILSNGNIVTSNRVGTKRIQMSINLGDNRTVSNPPLVVYWSDDIDVEGYGSATVVSESEHIYSFDLPSSGDLEICEWMKYRWVVNYENTLLSKNGIKLDEERLVMPDTYYSMNSVMHAACVSP